MPDLHGRGVGAQHVAGAIRARGHVECVHLGAGRVLGGNVQRVEIVPVAVNLRPLGHREPHIGEDRGQFVRDLADRVNGPLRRRAGGQRHIQPFGFQPLFQCCIGQRGLASADRRVDLVFQRVEGRARLLAFFRRHLAKLAHHQGDFALLAESRHAHGLDRGLIRRRRHLFEIFRPDGPEILHGALLH